MVAGVALWDTDVDSLRAKGVRDSKKISDSKRYGLCPVIESVAISVQYQIVTVEDINQHRGSKRAWIDAVNIVMRKALEQIAQVERKFNTRVVIDGVSVRGVEHLDLVRFVPRADDLVTAVGAASIVAKSVRNDIMRELHLIHPQYGWNENAGYHSAHHVAAIKMHGITAQHRAISPLVGL